MKRALLWTAAAGLLLLAGAAVALRVLFPPEKVQALALARLRDALGREVRLESASLGLRGIQLTGLEVSEKGPPIGGFQGSLSVGSLRLSVRWKPLLLKREVQIGRLSLADGEVSFTDPKAGVKARLTGVRLEAEDARLEGEFPLRLSLAYDARTKTAAHAGTLDLRGRLDAAGGDPARAGLWIEELKADEGGLALRARGRVAAKPLKADLSFDIPPADEKALKPLWPDVPKGLRTPALKGRLKVEETERGWRVNAEKLQILEGGSHDVKGSASVRASLRGASEFTAEADFKDAGFSAAGQTFSGLSGRARLAADSAAATLRGLWNKGRLEAEVSAEGLRGKQPRISFKGRLSELDLSTLPEAKGSPADAGEVPEKDSPSPKKGPASPKLASSGEATLGAIRHPNFQAAESRLTWNLQGLSADDFSTLNGKLSFRIGAGKLEDLKSLAAQKPLAKLVLLPVVVLQRVGGLVKVPLFPAFDRVRFKEIVGDYAVENGVVRIRKSHLDSSVAFAEMKGRADLVRDRLDLHVSTKLGAQVGLKLSGPIGFKVTGSLSNPKVALDPASVLKQPGVDKAVDNLRQQGEKLLKGLFKR